MAGLTLDPGGHVYAVGTQGTAAWVGAFHRCDGTLEKVAVVQVAGATSTRGSKIAVRGSQVAIVGTSVFPNDPGEGMVAILSKPTLSVSLASPLTGGGNKDEGWGIVFDGSGLLWMTGSTQVDVSPSFWGIKASTSGQACGFGASPEPGHGRAIVAGGDHVYMLGTRNNGAIGLRFDVANAQCATQGPCPCSPSGGSNEAHVGSVYTEPRGGVLVGTSLYTSGFATNDGTDYFGFVARIDVTTGEVIGSWTWNPTGGLDIFTSIASDGTNLYVVGASGWDLVNWSTATPIVASMPLSLSGFTWSAVPTGIRLATQVEVDDGVYVAGFHDTQGRVLRCTLGGQCP
jgi:hypothetical protein